MVESDFENRKWSGAILIRKATCVPNRPWCHVLLARLPPNNGFPPSACCPVCTTLMLLNRQVVYRAEWILSGTNAEEIWRFSQFRNNRCRLKNIQLSIAPYLNFTWPILSSQKPNKNRKNFPMFLISLHLLFSPICSKYPMNRGGAPSVPVMRHFLPNLSLEPTKRRLRCHPTSLCARQCTDRWDTFLRQHFFLHLLWFCHFYHFYPFLFGQTNYHF